MLYTYESNKLIDYYGNLSVLSNMYHNRNINKYHKLIFDKLNYIDNYITIYKVDGYLAGDKETNKQIRYIIDEHMINNKYITEDIIKYIGNETTFLYKYKIPYKNVYIIINCYSHSFCFSSFRTFDATLI